MTRSLNFALRIGVDEDNPGEIVEGLLMSDQIPDSISEHEPSMEDILASIRKVIAQDAPVSDMAAGQSESLDVDISDSLMDVDFEQDDILSRPGSVDDLQAEFDSEDIVFSQAGEIDDSSTQELLASVDSDLSDTLSEAFEPVDNCAASIFDDATLESTDPDDTTDILELTQPMDSPDVGLSGNGDVVAQLDAPVLEQDLTEDFDEDLDLAAVFGEDFMESDPDLDAQTAALLQSEAGTPKTPFEEQVDSDELSNIFEEIDAISSADSPVVDVAPIDDDALSSLDIDLTDFDLSAPELSADDAIELQDLSELTSPIDTDEFSVLSDVELSIPEFDDSQAGEAVTDAIDGGFSRPASEDAASGLAGKMAAFGASLGLGAAAAGKFGKNDDEVLDMDLSEIGLEETDEPVLDVSDLVAFESLTNTEVTSDVTSTDMNDIDISLDDIDLALNVPLDKVVDPAADLIETDTVQASGNDDSVTGTGAIEGKLGVSASQDEDIDLVKLLMAELTDDPFDEADDGALDVGADQVNSLDAVLEATMDDSVTDTTGLTATGEVSADVFDTVSGEAPSEDLADIIAEANELADAAGDSAVKAAEQGGDLSLSSADSLDDSLSLPVDESDGVQTAALDAPLPEFDAKLGEPESDLDSSNGAAALAGMAALMAGGLAGGSVLSSETDDAEPESRPSEMSADAKVSDLALDAEEQTDVPEDDTSLPAPKISLSKATVAAPKDIEIEDELMPHIVKSEHVASDDTVEAASDAFASLNQVVEEKAVFSESGPRIGDLVQDALKPMLQEWLDKNLKGIVDRAVAKEIKRISSGK